MFWTGLLSVIRSLVLYTQLHVVFYSKNKFGKLVHLVGFIIGICLYCPFPHSYLLEVRCERSAHNAVEQK